MIAIEKVDHLGIRITDRGRALAFYATVFGWTAAYAAAVALFDLATGANFLYLRHKPAQPTMLDGFGPWPLYIAVEALIAIVAFHLLMLPFRSRPSR